MEFDEMKMIWDKQKNEPLYVYDSAALHRRIVSKKETASRITNFSELMIIGIYILSGVTVLWVTYTSERFNIFMVLLALWMLVTSLYTISSRVKRQADERIFDRSILGDLKHAVSVASYQVNLSRLMLWNALPATILVFLALWSSGKPVWISLGLLIFYAVVLYASRWEHRFYVRRKTELETLQKKMLNEERNGD